MSKKKKRGPGDSSLLPVCVRVHGEVSSSNKRKVALRDLLLLPRTHPPPSACVPLPPLLRLAVSLFLARVPPRLSFHPCKQSNSKLPVVALRADDTDRDDIPCAARVSSERSSPSRRAESEQRSFRRNDGAAPSNRKGSELGRELTRKREYYSEKRAEKRERERERERREGVERRDAR